MNVSKPFLRITIATLLSTATPRREIERRAGVDRKTIRRYAELANSSRVATGTAAGEGQTPPPRPPALDEIPVPAPAPLTISACAAHRPWIEAQVALGRNAKHLPGSGRSPRLHASVQLRETLRADAEGAGPGALRRTGVLAGRRGAGRLRRRRRAGAAKSSGPICS